MLADFCSQTDTVQLTKKLEKARKLQIGRKPIHKYLEDLTCRRSVVVVEISKVRGVKPFQHAWFSFEAMVRYV